MFRSISKWKKIYETVFSRLVLLPIEYVVCLKPSNALIGRFKPNNMQ